MLNYNAYSRPGNNKENEDFYRIISNDNYTIFVLADGIGGRAKGLLAAQTSVEAICGVPINLENVGEWMYRAFKSADDTIAQKSEQLKCKMGCAIGCLIITSTCLYYSGLGDIRLYARSASDLTMRQVSIDDVIMGSNGCPYLTSSIRGRGLRDMPSVITIESSGIDMLRLCSDGYYNNNPNDDSTVIDIML